jgi:hypothetical protein
VFDPREFLAQRHELLVRQSIGFLVGETLRLGIVARLLHVFLEKLDLAKGDQLVLLRADDKDRDVVGELGNGLERPFVGHLDPADV